MLVALLLVLCIVFNYHSLQLVRNLFFRTKIRQFSSLLVLSFTLACHRSFCFFFFSYISERVWTYVFLLVGRYVTAMLLACLHISSAIRIWLLYLPFVSFSFFSLFFSFSYSVSFWIHHRESSNKGTSLIISLKIIL